MVARERLQHDTEGSMNKTIDELAENIKKLPDNRKKVLEDLLREKRLYSALEACELLGIALPTLRRQIELGRIKTTYVGRLLRIPSDEIARIMEGEETYLNSDQVAQVLSITKGTVCKMIKRGLIKATRFTPTGPFRVPKSEIERISSGEVSKNS
jgi:excisionase family DNA binding protein